MTAGEYCNREVVIAEPSLSITHAAQLMREKHVGDLVIVENRNQENIPIGVVTDRDLVIEVVSQEIPLDSVTVKDVMSTELVTVIEDQTLLDTVKLMSQKGVGRVLVVNQHAGLEGLLSADDVIELVSELLNDLVKLVNGEIKHEIRSRS